MTNVVITGCSTGIGLETALAFGRTGATVYATMRNPANATPLLDAAAADRSRVEVVALDVTDDASVTIAATAILTATGGRVDVVVNNAGIGGFGAVADVNLVQARNIMETNFWGPVRIIQAFVPTMRTHRSGVIVNVSSLAGRTPGWPTLGFYGASKHALGVISEALRYEVARDGIRVVVVEPGMHHTNVEANLPPIDTASPFADLAARARDMIVTGVRTGAEPAAVATAIVAAVNDPASAVHIPVGDDAVATIAAQQARGLPSIDRAAVAVFGDDVPIG
jgi:NAD(P)-dependent dehydrogenase (short-subunit alcohol dehydrogenase family)